MIEATLGYLVGLIVGIIMGLLSGGGSLLLPAMLYLFNQNETIATANTTILVGITALFGLIPRLRQKMVDWPTVLALGIPVSAGMLVARRWVIENIPAVLNIVGLSVPKKIVVLIPFVIVLLLSYATMVGYIGKNFKPRAKMRDESPVTYYAMLIIIGFLIGVVPGIAGAGGGVLIVPLLVIMFGLPIKTVVGTSLAIVAMKSFVGFFGGDVFNLGSQIDWGFLAKFSILMIVGALLGSQLSNKVDSDKLKKIFAWFILSLAIIITVKEIQSAFFPRVKPAPTVTTPESQTPNSQSKQANYGHKYFQRLHSCINDSLPG